MAKQGTTGSKKDRLITNNLIINSKENTKLNTKLASLEIQQRKEMARWEREKNKLSLPSLKANCRGISLTPPPSPTTSPLPSPVMSRRKSDTPGITRDASRTIIEHPSGNDRINIGSGSVGLRRSKSSQNIRLSVSPHPPCGLGSASPKLLHRRSTMGQVCVNHEGRQPSHIDIGRRFSAGVIPSIRIEDNSERLNEKVKKFNESLKKLKNEGHQSKEKADDTNSDEDEQTPNDVLSILPRPIAHRWKSLPSLFPTPGSGEKSTENMTFYEDMKRCRYLRIPDSPALSMEQIFKQDVKQTVKELE